MRRMLLVGDGPRLPMPPGEVRHVPDLDSAIEAALWADVIFWHSRTMDLDVDAVQRLRVHAPIIVLGPMHDVVLAAEVLLAGADDFVEYPAIDADTLHLAVECAHARRQANERADRERRHAFEATIKEREAALRRSLIDHLADRLHNPLTVLTLQTSILTHRLPEDDRGRADQLLRATNRMRRIIDDITSAYHATSASITNIEPVDLGAVVRRVLDGDDERIRRQTWSVVADPAWIRNDANMVHDVVYHMMEHAGNVVPVGTPVRMRINNDVQGACLRMALPTTVGAGIFEPFAGMEDLATEGALGLEMYVARTIARRIGGELALEHAEPDATFVLRLPSSAPTITHASGA